MKPLLRVLRGESVTPPPIWLMRQAGRYLPEYRELRQRVPGLLDLCFNPALAAEATLQPIRRYALDAAILFSDILVVAYGLGRPVSFREGEGPVLDPLRSAAELSALSLEGFDERVAPVYETVRRVATVLSSSTTLIGFAGAPWTVATYMVEGGTSRDFATVRRWALGDSGSFAELIDQLTEATIRYLAAQIAAGAEAVQLFDSWAGVLPEHAFRRWVIEPSRGIAAVLKETAPALPMGDQDRNYGASLVAFEMSDRL